jgi:hypothetical protein
MIGQHASELPSVLEVLDKRLRPPLDHDVNRINARIYEIGEHEIDDSVFAAERNRGLGAVAGKRMKPRPLASGHYEREGSHREVCVSGLISTSSKVGVSISIRRCCEKLAAKIRLHEGNFVRDNERTKWNIDLGRTVSCINRNHFGHPYSSELLDYSSGWRLERKAHQLLEQFPKSFVYIGE